MQINPDQISKILLDILKPLLGNLANKVVEKIVERIKQANDSNTQESRVTIRNGYTIFSPLYPIKSDIAQQKPATFNEVHKLGTKRSSHINEESKQTYSNYKTQADQHKAEREAGKAQREAQHNNKPNNNNESVNNHKPHFSLFRK